MEVADNRAPTDDQETKGICFGGNQVRLRACLSGLHVRLATDICSSQARSRSKRSREHVLASILHMLERSWLVRRMGFRCRRPRSQGQGETIRPVRYGVAVRRSTISRFMQAPISFVAKLEEGPDRRTEAMV